MTVHEFHDRYDPVRRRWHLTCPCGWTGSVNQMSETWITWWMHIPTNERPQETM